MVDTVIAYFNRFMENYPAVHDLAKADEQDVLKSWEGLGYYSRARNLQNAVREVVASYNGEVPSDPEALVALKGVGPYPICGFSIIDSDQLDSGFNVLIMHNHDKV